MKLQRLKDVVPPMECTSEKEKPLKDNSYLARRLFCTLCRRDCAKDRAGVGAGAGAGAGAGVGAGAVKKPPIIYCGKCGIPFYPAGTHIQTRKTYISEKGKSFLNRLPKTLHKLLGKNFSMPLEISLPTILEEHVYKPRHLTDLVDIPAELPRKASDSDLESLSDPTKEPLWC